MGGLMDRSARCAELEAMYATRSKKTMIESVYGYVPTRRATQWWRVIYDRAADGVIPATPRALWCETSDEAEARAALRSCPGPKARLQRLFVLTDGQWEDQ